ncbi:hypothetical protein OS493_012297 [Desmophyllum pertusum]|uniref:Uncharacterized protein n=1 Tax=Desmophyllum pertusum TaxID=174260 RepID=A0A9W9ZQJ8_9CNID|nr:hypothetical protein OS493_012297 [Desmophyllum pertusum]
MASRAIFSDFPEMPFGIVACDFFRQLFSKQLYTTSYYSTTTTVRTANSFVTLVLFTFLRKLKQKENQTPTTASKLRQNIQKMKIKKIKAKKGASLGEKSPFTAFNWATKSHFPWV